MPIIVPRREVWTRQPQVGCRPALGRTQHLLSAAIGPMDLAAGMLWTSTMPINAGQKGKAFAGNGSGYLQTTTPNIQGHGYTFAAWVLFSNVTTNQGISAIGTTSNGHRIQIDVNSGSVRNICVGSATGVASAAITANTWAHIAAVGESANRRLMYVNGVPGTADTTSVTFTGPFTIGDIGCILTSGNAAATFMASGGYIVDPIWLDKAMTAEEVALLYANHNRIFTG